MKSTFCTKDGAEVSDDTIFQDYIIWNNEHKRDKKKEGPKEENRDNKETDNQTGNEELETAVR